VELRRIWAMGFVLVVATALAGVALLGRMAPAIGDILDENVATVDAVQRMLAALARGDERATEGFEEALAVAENNVTEEAERPLLETIRRESSPALAGDPLARREVVAALSSLGEVNEAAMRTADDEARALGSAGAWAIAILCLAGLLALVVGTRRVRRRLLLPLEELHGVLGAWVGGDPHRRCRPATVGALAPVLEAVNSLLDEARVGVPGRDVRVRRALGFLLEMQGAALVLDSKGEVIAMSDRALARMEEDGDAILEASREDGEHPAIEERMGSDEVVLIRLTGAGAAPDSSDG